MRRIRNPKLCPILSAKLSSLSREELPVIIQSRDEDSSRLNSVVFNMSGEVKNNLPLIGGIAANLTTDAIYRLVNDPNIEYISFDSKVFALLDIATATIKVDMPQDRGYFGEGVTVAVIDTGIAPHSDLTRPENRIVGFKDFVNDKTSPYDDNGHGTHVTGIIAGNGYSSNGKYAGVAPKANILGVKALDETGSGNTSDIISAISWIIETKDQYKTNVVNLSLGSPANNPCSSDPLCRAVNEAVRAGLTVVVAAGNSGPSAKTILSPGISPSVITVGAVDDKRTPNPGDDTVASFSSRGPTEEGLIKPDVVAPGVNIMSLSNKKLDGYTSLSGSSMATPLVSGSLALLFDKYEKLSPKEAKTKILQSTIDLNEKKEDQGAGMINLEKIFKVDPKEPATKEPQKNPTRPSWSVNPSKPQKPNESFIPGMSGDFIENILVLLIVLFLLDRN